MKYVLECYDVKRGKRLYAVATVIVTVDAVSEDNAKEKAYKAIKRDRYDVTEIEV